MHNSLQLSFLKSHFAPAFFSLSGEKRRGLQVLYGFFRYLDDIADTLPAESARPILDQWQQFFKDRDPSVLTEKKDQQIAAALESVIKTFDIPTFVFLDFLEKGMLVDMNKTQFETPLDTESYCYGVAGTVGIACLPVFGVPVAEGRDFATRLGIGVQWINILRDVGVDAQLGRIYLPQDHLDKFGCSRTEILDRKQGRTFESLIRYEGEVARSHYRRAQELLPTQWKRELKPALIMGEIYSKLLAKIEKHHYAVLDRRFKLNLLEKAAAAWSVLRKN